MNPQPRDKTSYDARKERLDHARLTGEYVDYPGGSNNCEIVDGVVRLKPKFKAFLEQKRQENMNPVPTYRR